MLAVLFTAACRFGDAPLRGRGALAGSLCGDSCTGGRLPWALGTGVDLVGQSTSAAAQPHPSLFALRGRRR
eukprot:33217-Pyramimonas_sp.AAC.1